MLNSLLKILGIENVDNVTLSDIKRAYKRRALEFHPDKGGDEEKFKELNNAYNRLIEKPSAIKKYIKITLHDLIINKNKKINIKVHNIKNRTYFQKQIDIIFKEGFKNNIILYNLGDEGLFVNGDIILNIELELSKNFEIDHKLQQLKHIITLTYLDVYFVEELSFFYTFIDGSKYKINYKKNGIIKDEFYIPKCNLIYENKEYKFLINVKIKRPSDIEINVIKQSVYKYTVPRGIEHGFIGENNKELDHEMEDIIKRLDYMNMKDIVEFCKDKEIKGYSRYKRKNDLIEYIKDEFMF